MTLKEAIDSGSPTAVAAALEHPDVRSHINDPLRGGAFGQTALISAVQHANREVIDVLLRAGADINQKSHWWAGGFHVLDDAWKEPWLASFLIGRGATVGIHHAVRLGMIDQVRAIVASDPSLVNARGGDGQLPLHFAQTIEVADCLMSRGAAVNARDVDHESTAAQWMIRDRQDVARHLVSHGSEVDVLMAAALGDVTRLTELLDERPERIFTRVSDRWFTKRDPRAGGTIYIWTLGGYKNAHAVARDFGRGEVLEALMRRTPDALKLVVACEAGDEPRVRQLLRDHADVRQSLPPFEEDAMLHAAERNNAAAVRLMLDAGWPANAAGRHGVTGLHWAGFHGNLEMARALLRYHAPVHVTETDFNGTPLSWAEHGAEHGWYRASGDYPGTIDALVGAGASRKDRP
jgi:ankyrin repeat protein